jgi:hypothetical protein
MPPSTLRRWPTNNRWVFSLSLSARLCCCCFVVFLFLFFDVFPLPSMLYTLRFFWFLLSLLATLLSSHLFHSSSPSVGRFLFSPRKHSLIRSPTHSHSLTYVQILISVSPHSPAYNHSLTCQYREVANLLESINDISVYFKDYQHLEQIVNIHEKVTDMKSVRPPLPLSLFLSNSLELSRTLSNSLLRATFVYMTV